MNINLNNISSSSKTNYNAPSKSVKVNIDEKYDKQIEALNKIKDNYKGQRTKILNNNKINEDTRKQQLKVVDQEICDIELQIQQIEAEKEQAEVEEREKEFKEQKEKMEAQRAKNNADIDRGDVVVSKSLNDLIGVDLSKNNISILKQAKNRDSIEKGYLEMNKFRTEGDYITTRLKGIDTAAHNYEKAINKEMKKMNDKVEESKKDAVIDAKNRTEDKKVEEYSIKEEQENKNNLFNNDGSINYNNPIFEHKEIEDNDSNDEENIRKRTKLSKILKENEKKKDDNNIDSFA